MNQINSVHALHVETDEKTESENRNVAPSHAKKALAKGGIAPLTFNLGTGAWLPSRSGRL
jgi:hypothetical protein